MNIPNNITLLTVKNQGICVCACAYIILYIYAFYCNVVRSAENQTLRANKDLTKMFRFVRSLAVNELSVRSMC
jgi:hypothetical protein